MREVYQVNGKEYEIVRLLGHGKGGYSYLAEHERKRVVLKQPTRVAILPVGYQNGFGVADQRKGGLWALLRRWWKGRRLWVRVGSQRIKVLGKVGAIETLLDVTDQKCASGDIAVFEIDPQFARGLKKEYR